MSGEKNKISNEDIAREYFRVKSAKNPDNTDSYRKIAEKIAGVKASLEEVFNKGLELPFGNDTKEIITSILTHGIDGFREKNAEGRENELKLDFQFGGTNIKEGPITNSDDLGKEGEFFNPFLELLDTPPDLDIEEGADLTPLGLGVDGEDLED
nr:hypothetical protein [Candidatus Gracilibacteria bacterium]